MIYSNDSEAAISSSGARHANGIANHDTTDSTNVATDDIHSPVHVIMNRNSPVLMNCFRFCF
ncbi:MAG: hypothetical protein KGY80_11340, partial [Candidatus Thorarchaeota archaeon]|nr:hypothetical protein [Candidatus Thorarchaeota archaeon]